MPENRESVASYVADFARKGREVAYEHRRGLRREQWSYGRVAELAYRFARELEARGIRKGDRVVLWGPSSAEWVGAFFGCALAGVVAVPLDDSSTHDFARRVVAQVGPSLALIAEDHARVFGGIPTLELESLEAAVSGRDASPMPPVSGRDDTLEVIYTSGTTSTPRGVRITNGNVLASLEVLEPEIAKYIKFERPFHPIRFLSLVPLSHVFGQFMGLFVPQLLTGLVIFGDSLVPSHVVQTIRARRVSVLVAVPRILRALRDHLERAEEAAGRARRFSRELEEADHRGPGGRMWAFRRIHRQFGWKFWAFVSGGATLEADTERFWRRLGYAVVQGYGSTETASLVSVNHPFRMGEGSIGRVMPGREIRIDENGEILVRGANVSPGYWDQEGARGEEEWLRTGDYGRLDEDGNLYFLGRKADLIVTAAGMNVFPDDLEAALAEQAEIVDACVAGVDLGAGPQPVAAVRLRAGFDDAAAAIERANAQLAEHQRIRRWVVWPEPDFPRTSTHKVRRSEVGERLAAMLLDSDGAGARQGALEAIVRGVAGEGRAASLAELDSLQRVELLAELEERYQVDIDEQRFAEVRTFEELSSVVAARAATTGVRDFVYPRWPQRAPVVWLRWLVFHLLTVPAIRLLVKPRYVGRETLRDVSQPALIVANHIASADAGFVLHALPAARRGRLAIAMEGERLEGYRTPAATLPTTRRAFERLKWLLVTALFNVFPLPQRGGHRRSFDFAGDLVDRGFSVLVFPEGRMTITGEMGPFRAGIGVLALELGVPVVPVHLGGLARLKLEGRRFARPGEILVTIGEPVRYERDRDPEEIAADLEARVRALES